MRIHHASQANCYSAVYLISLGFAIYAMLPNKMNNIQEEDEDDSDERSTTSDPKYNTEMQALGSPRAMAFTPRTQAFHTLDRKFPQQTVRETRYA